jgi:hypothetical protein
MAQREEKTTRHRQLSHRYQTARGIVYRTAKKRIEYAVGMLAERDQLK